MDAVDIDALLASATLPEKTVPLCLRPDLRTRFEELDAELVEARATRTTLAPSAREQDLAAEMEHLDREIERHTLRIRLRGLKHGPWVRLCAAHPPRRDVVEDAVSGVNMETFPPAMILAETLEPEMTAQQLDRLIDAITDNQYQTLQNTAWDLSRSDRDAPVFSRAASLVMPDSGETSRQQSGSGSPRPGSRAKKPKN